VLRLCFGDVEPDYNSLNGASWSVCKRENEVMFSKMCI
jgi:hypothetical protein